MNLYGLQGQLQAKEGQGKALADILIQASQLLASAKGCHLYLVAQDRENSDLVRVTEVWDTKEDHGNSLKDDKVRALIGQALPILAEMPKGGVEMTVLGGLGL